MTCQNLHTADALALELAESTEPARLRARLRTCPDCSRAAAELHDWSRRVDHPNPLVAPEVRTAPALLDRLLDTDPDDRTVRIRADVELQSWGLASLLLERSMAVRFDQPQDADELARLAIAVSGSLDEGFYGVAEVADLRARAHARAADAARRLDELRIAEGAIAFAEDWARRGLERPGLLAEIRLIQARLATDRGELVLAREVAAKARDLFRRAGDPHGQVRAELEQARIESLTGRASTALGIYEDLLPRLVRLTDLSLRRHALYDFALELIAADDPDRIAVVLVEFPADDLLLLLCRGWLQAVLDHRGGLLENAEQHYQKLRRSFLDLSLPRPAALVALELVRLMLEIGRIDIAHTMAGNLYQVLACPGLRPEEAAALVEFVREARQGHLDTTLVRWLQGELHRGPRPPHPLPSLLHTAAEVEARPPA